MNAAIVEHARSYLGVRWHHQGRNREGVDCIGLVIVCARDVLGWTYDITGYDRQANDETMLRLCQQHLKPIRRSELAPGDVVVIKFQNQRHAAIVGDYPEPGHLSLIHAYATSRKVVEQRLDTSWRERIVGCFRFPVGGG